MVRCARGTGKNFARVAAQWIGPQRTRRGRGGKAESSEHVLAAVSLIKREFQDCAAVETNGVLGLENGLAVAVAAARQIIHRPAGFIGDDSINGGGDGKIRLGKIGRGILQRNLDCVACSTHWSKLRLKIL